MPPPLPSGRQGSILSLSLVPLAASILAAVVGLVALLGWLLRSPLLASLGGDLIPMAPSTAVLFVVYGAAVGLRAWRPASRRGFWLSAAVGSLGALVALLLFVAGCLDIHWAVERLGLNITGSVGGAPVGHMSPVTAFCFLLASASFLASLGRSAPPPGRAVLAAGAASLLLAICLVFLLAYFYGGPLLYGGRVIPPALNTILAFALLGLALLALVGQSVGVFGGVARDGSKAAFAFVLTFILLAAGIVATGYLYYRSSEQRHRAEIERQLAAIGEMKAGELQQFRRERLGDADILFQNVSFSVLVRRYLEKPEDSDVQRQLETWLRKIQSHYQYDQAFLLDTQSVTRMAVPVAPAQVAGLIAQRESEVLRSGQVVFQDFYRNEHNQRVYLALLIPLLDDSEVRRPLGMLVLRIDPVTYLHPFVQKWPTLSLTAETLLVRREGNDALFLNELRFQTNTALNLRISLGNTHIAAVKAALGQAGIVEARDYRGVPVIADVRAIPDSPWFLVSKMDTAELYGPLRERLAHVVLMMSGLLLGAGFSAGSIWRRQRVRFGQERVVWAESLRASEVRYRRLFEAAQEGILMLEASTGRIADANPFLTELLGCPREALLSKRVWEVDGFRAIIPDEASFAELRRQGCLRADDKLLQRADGKRIEIEFVSNLFEMGRRQVMRCTFLDVTAHKQAEKALRDSEARYRTLFEAMDEGFCVIEMLYDPDGQPADYRFLEINPAFMKQTGLTDALTKTMREMVPDHDAHWFQIYGQVARTGESIRFENPAVAMQRHYDVFAFRIGGEGSRRVGILFNDITVRKRAEETRAADLAAMTQLQRIEALYLGEGNLPRVLDELVGAAIAVTGADFGNFQLHDPATDTLTIRAQRGFAPDWVEFWNTFYTGKGACHTALARRQRVLVEDVTTNPIFAGTPALPVQLKAGVRAVQSTPIISRTGQVLGMISTHWRRPHRPTDRVLRWLDLLAGQTADILERGRAEAALRESQDRLTLAMRTAQMGSWSCDLKTGRLTADAASFALHGLAEGEVVASLEEGNRHIHPDDLPEVRRRFEHAVQTQGTYENEYRVVLPDGSLRWTYSLGRVPEGSSYLIGMVQDITTRKQAEAALRESELRFRTLVTQSPIGIYETDPHGGCVFVNARWSQISGLSPETARGDGWVQAIHPEDRASVFAEWRSAAASGHPFDLQYRFLTPQGVVTWVHGLAAPVRNEHDEIVGYFGTISDITARKQAEAALRTLSLQLSRAEEGERRRIARELHDSTGQKLAALNMTVGVLQDAAGPQDREREKMLADSLAMIEECAQEIRTFSYLLHPPLLDELGLAAAIDHCAEGFSKRSGVRVVLEAPRDLERLPEEVEMALFRVVQECLSNIHRHAKASSARIRLAADAAQVTLEVSDQGRGMSAETLRALEAGGGSAGVGIAGMRERLRLLGGRLEIESNGQGTTIRALVPRRQAMAE